MDGHLPFGMILYRLMRLRVKQWVPSARFGWLCLGWLFDTTGLRGVQIGVNLAAGETPKGRSVELAWPLALGLDLVANGGAAASIDAHAALLTGPIRCTRVLVDRVMVLTSSVYDGRASSTKHGQSGAV